MKNNNYCINYNEHCNNSCNKTCKNNKFNLPEKKKNIIKSLADVECFLNNLKNVSKGAHLYKIIK